MNNNNLEKKTIPLGKALNKKDIFLFLSSISGNFSYGASNFGDFKDGVNICKQNECIGEIPLKGTRIAYAIHICGEQVLHMHLEYPSTIDRETLEGVERKISEFFSAYSSTAS